MAQIKIFGDSFVVTSRLKVEDIQKLKTFKPESLKLIDEETKDELYAVNYKAGSEGSFSKYGASFNSQNEAGNATLTVAIPAGKNNAEKVDYVKNTYGQSLLKLKELEDQLEAAAVILGDEMNAVEASIEVIA
jgi:hypothetical protein